jgi:hypothetical protein
MDRGAPTGPDLTYNYDTNVLAPDTTKPNSLWAACPHGVRGLTYDWSAMATLVMNMAANGNTNQAIGLQVDGNHLSAVVRSRCRRWIRSINTLRSSSC